MKNLVAKGILVGLLHVMIILALGAKLLYDRAQRPRVWVQTAPVDPDLPIRGRYIMLGLQVHSPKSWSAGIHDGDNVQLSVEDNQLIASKSEVPTGLSVSPQWQRGAQQDSWRLNEPVAFFIPEHAAVSFPPQPGEKLWGEDLWVEVTVPHKGRPRPIRLGIKRGSQWQPLNLR
jgi:uncharacterized membrane-anchored protein